MTSADAVRGKPALTDIAAVLVVTAMLVGGWWVSGHGVAGPIAMHFGFDGRPDRWGDRADVGRALLVMAGLAALMLGVSAVLSRQAATPGWRSTLRLARAVTAIVFALVGLLFAGLGMGWLGGTMGASGWAMALVGAVMLVVGAVMGRARPNPLLGVRTYWTLTSRLAWDKANRLAGRLLFMIGLATLAATPFAPQPLGLHLVVVAVLLAAAASVFESWRVWRTDPDRRPGRDIPA